MTDLHGVHISDGFDNLPKVKLRLVLCQSKLAPLVLD